MLARQPLRRWRVLLMQQALVLLMLQSTGGGPVSRRYLVLGVHVAGLRHGAERWCLGVHAGLLAARVGALHVLLRVRHAAVGNSLSVGLFGCQ